MAHISLTLRGGLPSKSASDPLHSGRFDFGRDQLLGHNASVEYGQVTSRAWRHLNTHAVNPKAVQPLGQFSLPDSASLRPRPCCRGRMFVIEVFVRGRTPSIPRNGAGPRHEDGHLMISLLRPPPRKTRPLFRRFSTDHGEARTSTTAACRVAASMAQISPQHRRLHPPSYSSPPSQTAQLAARHTPVTPANALKSP